MKKTLGFLLVCVCTTIFAQPNTFTYQGRLIENGIPVDGIYDLRLTVYDALADGNALVLVTNSSTAVSNGLFSTTVSPGANSFDGSARWLEIAIRTNGDTAGFTSLLPRQAMTATPYALRALSAASAVSVSNGVYASANQTFGGANQFTNGANSFSGNGAGLTNVNAATVNGLSASGFWQTAGNSNTVDGTHFLGTTDNHALELRVNGARALRLEPSASGSPNLIGGAAGNGVTGSGITIGGGSANKVQGANFSTIAGGTMNVIQTNATSSVIPGGETNVIQTGADHSVIGGGYNNTIQNASYYSSIGGGSANTIQPNSSNGTIAGGNGNSVRAFSSTIGGGNANLIDTNAYGATISGGVFHSIQSNATHAVIGGGLNNTISTNASYSVITGGHLNTIQANAQQATIVGGDNNQIGSAGTNSLAAGHRAKALHAGAFVWADGSNFDFASTVTNSFSVRAVSGVRFVTAIDSLGNPINGVSLAAGSGSWTSLSDRNAKENFVLVNAREVLRRVGDLPLTTWNYKTQDKAIRHIGPMAQDFAAAFQVGEDDRHITTIDEDGVALAAIQGLNQVVKEKDAEIQALKASHDSMEKRLSDLEQLIKSTAVRNLANP